MSPSTSPEISTPVAQPIDTVEFPEKAPCGNYAEHTSLPSEGVTMPPGETDPLNDLSTPERFKRPEPVASGYDHNDNAIGTD